jgi:hypothetical protein
MRHANSISSLGLCSQSSILPRRQFRGDLGSSAKLAAEIADSVVLAAVSVTRAIRQDIEGLFIEPTVIATGMLAAVLDTHILGTSLVKKLHNGANMRAHR